MIHLPHRALARVALLVAFASASAAQESAPRIEVGVSSREAEVGDPIDLTLTVDLAADSRLEPSVIGPDLGPFAVDGGRWSGPLETETGQRWSWAARLIAFETGELEVPPISLRVTTTEGESVVSSEPIAITIRSVLTAAELEEGEPEIADLKPPASVPADFGPLRTALIVLAVLLAGAGLLWWLHRRYASRFAAVPVSSDPFHRTPPHVWIYAELRQLLEQRLPEQGEVERFYGELSRLLKRYLSGRFRVELLEHTSAEIPTLLEQAGATADAIGRVEKVLAGCDQVKFARVLPESTAWRSAVEEIYRIVDTTKPVEAAPEAARAGAA